MFTKREWKIIGILLIIFVACLAAVFLTRGGTNPGNTGIENQQLNTEEIAKQRIAQIKELNKTPMAGSARQVFNFISGTTTEATNKILSQPIFAGVKDSFSGEMLKSKFVPINGSAINGVGAQLFILFPAYPEHVYRLAFALTNSTTTPLTIVAFEKSEDKRDSIDNFLKDLQPYLNDPEVTK